jgi:CRISPR/Cas system-associated exonuclease Cas4 (RecB family)
MKMRVEEVEGKTCDLKLEDITEEEYGAMFLEGIRELVSEARKGMVSDYIVLPYEDVPDEIKDKAKGNTWEVSDEDADALLQIGAVSMIKRGLKVAEEEDYYAKLQKLADTDEWESDEDKEGM